MTARSAGHASTSSPGQRFLSTRAGRTGTRRTARHAMPGMPRSIRTGLSMRCSALTAASACAAGSPGARSCRLITWTGTARHTGKRPAGPEGSRWLTGSELMAGRKGSRYSARTVMPRRRNEAAAPALMAQSDFTCHTANRQRDTLRASNSGRPARANEPGSLEPRTPS